MFCGFFKAPNRNDKYVFDYKCCVLWGGRTARKNAKKNERPSNSLVHTATALQRKKKATLELVSFVR